MAYGASLESWLGASPHGFESHILRRKKPQITLGLFLFRSGFVDHRHQGLGIIAADDKPVPLVVFELNNDYLFTPTPK